MKGLLFGLALLALLVGLNGCVHINGQITRPDKQEKYSGVVPWPGFGDQPTVVVADPYYRYPYYRSSYHSSYYRSSHTGYGGYVWNGCKVVRGPHYQEPRPPTWVISRVDINVNRH